MAQPSEENRPPVNLQGMLERLAEAEGDSERVSIADIAETVGRRSFGPLLLCSGLIAISPLSGIPGMPTTVAVMVILVAGQILLGRENFWLPQWILNRSIPRQRLEQALAFLRPPSRFIDRILRPRLALFTRHPATRVIAAASLVVALMMPPMEFVPFAAALAGTVLSAFGLALIAHDGLLALLALILAVGTVGLLISYAPK